MNPTIVKALLSEQFKRTFPILVLSAGISVVSSLIAYLDYRRIENPIHSDLVSASEIALGGIVLAHFCAIVAFLYCYSDDRDLRLTMPAHLLRLPVRTGELVFWRMGYSVVCMAMLGLLSSSCFYALFSSEIGSNETMADYLPFWIPMLAGVTIFVCLQALAWTVGGSGAGVTGVAGGLYILTLSLVNDFEFTLIDPEMYKGLAIPVLLAIALCVSWAGVALRRRGSLDLENVFGGRLPALSLHRDGELRPFESAEAAMRWFEWRRQGWNFPVFVALLSITFAIFAIRTNSVIETLEWSPDQVRAFVSQVVAIAFYTALGLAVFMFGAYALFQNQRIQLGPEKSFLFIRPVSTRSLALARTTVALRSLLLAIVPMCIVSLVTIYLALQIDEKSGVGAMIERYGSLQAFIIALFLLLGLCGALWCVYWSGNGLAVLMIFAIPMIVMQTIPAFDSLSPDQVETYALGVTALVTIPTTLYLFYRARRERLLDVKALLPWIVAWPFVLGGFLTFANWVNLQDGNPFVLFGESVPVLAVAMVPILPLATVPLIMQYARHR